MGPGDERTPPMTPQLALRVAVIGGCALVMFAVIFFRLWFLQVLTGSQYLAQAHANDTQPISVAAPRGEILASNGTVLVSSVPTPSVQISAGGLPTPLTATDGTLLSSPPADDAAIYRRLAKVLGMSTRPRTCRYNLWVGPKKHPQQQSLSPIACLVAQGVSQAPYANVTIKTDVSSDIQAYLAERSAVSKAFKGVITREVYERQYPFGDLAAQLFGTVGPISAVELKQKHYRHIPATDAVGQSGLEYEYNQWLQGTDGSERARVNAEGQFEGWEKGVAPTAGDNLQLSLDPTLQRAGQNSLAESIADHPPADAGAFVAMDPDNGQIYAMGSSPTFKPSVFSHPLTTREYDALYGRNSDSPTLNRAIQGLGPDGSTFKVVTATAALESGALSLDYVYDDATGKYCIPGSNQNIEGDCPQNSGGQAYGPVDLVQALKFSVDTFFYRLGDLMNVDSPQGGALQKWAKEFGVGEPTGVDLPGELSGTLPSPAWVDQLNKLQNECVAKHRKQYAANPSVCEISDDSPWTVGDNVHAAVGQGDVQVTPLQLAVVYSAIANGGTIVTPHVGMDVKSPDGTVLDRIHPAPKRRLDIDPSYLSAIRQGLYEAAHDSGGTSADVMSGFPEPVYGKTGTAEYGETAESAALNPDYAWYACFVPASATRKPIVVVVWVEKGGFGDVAAAPVARQILSQWFLGKPGPFKSGTSDDL